MLKKYRVRPDPLVSLITTLKTKKGVKDG